jgi:hypothetical protein
MTLKGILITGITGWILSSNSIAGSMGPIQGNADLGSALPWVAIGSVGYTTYQNVGDCEGQSAFGRFAIGKEIFATNHTNFGLELGVQSGNNMILEVSEASLDELGGVPIQSTIKPLIDLLATVKIKPSTSPFFADMKGGAAYRHWQFDGRNSVRDISKIAGEVQVGVGLSVGSFTSLSLLYQRIFGGDPNFTLNQACPSGRVSTIPTQQGVMLSFSIKSF